MELNEDIDYVDGYDCRDLRVEPLPDVVIFSEPFAQLKSKCAEVKNLLLGPLMESDYENAVTKGLLLECENRTKNERSGEVMFAVAGDMAAGKSSVINSILSVGTIARKGDGGGSCTWVVQRFMKRFESQPAPFAARVHFFNPTQIKEVLKGLLAKYYRARPTENLEEETKEDFVENFAEIRTVLDSLMPLFCGMDEFETEERAQAFLNQAKSEYDDNILEKVATFAGDVIFDHLCGMDYVAVDASTPEELLFKLQPYTYTLPNDSGEGISCPWPLVSVIDFGLDHPLLNEGIIFVDSPGLSDANSARAANAKMNHMKCTHKITVADISRSKDDNRLRENLAQGYLTRGSGNTVLVLTYGDTIDEDTDVTGQPLEKRKERILIDELKALRDEKKSLTKKRAKMSREEKLDTEDDWMTNIARTKAKNRELEALRMDMRNRSVVQTMQRQYKDLTCDPKPLSAFAVGNNDYKRHVAGYTTDEIPTLSVKQTNIPALRNRLFLLPAEGKLNDLLHLSTTQLPSLVNTFTLYCSKAHMARKKEIEAIIIRPKETVKELMNATLDKLQRQVQEFVITPMKRDEAEWINGARQLCRKWAKNHASNHFQMLKREGSSKAKTKEHTDVAWNAELASLQRKKIQQYFGQLCEALVSHFLELRPEIVRLFDDTRRAIRADPQFNVMALDVFLQSFDIEKPNAITRILRVFKDIHQQVGNVMEATTTADGESYFSQAMKPIYSHVRSIKGRGAPDARPRVFEMKVCRIGGVWPDVQDRIEAAFEKLHKQQMSMLMPALESVFNDIINKFNLMCEDTEVKNETEKSQEDKLRSKLKENLTKARELVDGDIQALAAECKNYSTVKEENSIFVSGD